MWPRKRWYAALAAFFAYLWWRMEVKRRTKQYRIPHDKFNAVEAKALELAEAGRTTAIGSLLPLRLQHLMRRYLHTFFDWLALCMGGSALMLQGIFRREPRRTFLGLFMSPRNRLNVPYGSSGNQCDVYYPPLSAKQTPTQVIVFVHGGTWGSGNKLMYRLLGRRVSRALGAVVVIPGYRVWPAAQWDGQVAQIRECVQFVSDDPHQLLHEEKAVCLPVPMFICTLHTYVSMFTYMPFLQLTLPSTCIHT